jgi:hypothetical protein
MWIDPYVVGAWRSGRGEAVPVYRTVQGPGEYVLTDYGAVHWGVNLGVGWKAAVNFAFPGWLKSAREVRVEIGTPASFLIHLCYNDKTHRLHGVYK